MTETSDGAPAAPLNAVDQGIADAMRVYELVPEFARIRRDTLLADVWERPELAPRDKSIVTCTVLAVLGKMDELGAHLRKASENGVTDEEIRGMVVQIAFYAGWPAGLGFGKAALEILDKK